MSIALTKQRERPFSFHQRDLERAKSAEGLRSEFQIPDVMKVAPFKASIIPWRVRAPLYQEMIERTEYAREQRIKRNAEISLSLSKLPPRMQEHEMKKKLEAETGGAINDKSQSQPLENMFSFMPGKAKPVPDFKRLQKQFVQNLEDLKRQKHMSTTVPEPFHFHNPKPTARMRRYLDAENQLINPTLKKLRSHSAATIDHESPVKGGKRDDRENPAITSKFSAYVT